MYSSPSPPIAGSLGSRERHSKEQLHGCSPLPPGSSPCSSSLSAPLVPNPPRPDMSHRGQPAAEATVPPQPAGSSAAAQSHWLPPHGTLSTGFRVGIGQSSAPLNLRRIQCVAHCAVPPQTLVRESHPHPKC